MRASSSLPFARALPWLLFITSIFFLNFVGRTIFSPLMVAMEHDMGFSHARAGRLFLDVAVGYGIALLLSGFVSSRITHRQTIALMPLLMGVVLLALAACRSLLLFEFLLVIFGMCGGLYLPSGVSAVTSLVKPTAVGKAIGIHELAPNLSLISAPLIAQAFLDVSSWRTALAVLGVISFVLSALFIRFGRGGDFRSTRPSFASSRDIMRRPVFWVLLCIFGLSLGGSIGPYSVLPLFLVDEHGMDPGHANHLLSLSRLITPLVAFMAGWVVDRLGIRATIAVTMALTGLCTVLMGLLHGSLLVTAVIAQPVFSACFFPAGFALLSRHFPAESRSMAVSLVIPVGIVCGYGLTPALLGWLGDHGSFGTGFVMLGAAIAATPIVLRLVASDGPPASDSA